MKTQKRENGHTTPEWGKHIEGHCWRKEKIVRRWHYKRLILVKADEENSYDHPEDTLIRDKDTHFTPIGNRHYSVRAPR